MAVFRSMLRCALLGSLLAGLAVTATAQTLAAPAPGASCVVTAQNRTAPLSPSGDYVLYNLPGNGLAPFGTDGSAQPFRVRATCDDGTVGETPMTFPVFEQRVVNPGTITWGLNTPVPDKLVLTLPGATLSEGQALQAGVAATYPDGSTRDVTARATGTGYRTSASAFVGVSTAGNVYMQPAWLQTAVGTRVVAPPQVVITAENDGVVASRVVKLVSTRTVTGRVLQADGSPAPAGHAVRLVLFNGWQAEVLTASGGVYTFSGLPAGYVLGAMYALGQGSREFAHAWVYLDPEHPVTQVDLRLPSPGTLRVSVVDGSGAPVAGVDVSFQDDAARSGLLPAAAPVVRTGPTGIAQFQGVAPGFVAALVAGKVRELKPESLHLRSGGVVDVQVRLDTGPEQATASVSGVAFQQGQPAVGMRVQLLELDGLGRSLSQPVSPSGAYRFDDLQPGSLHAISVVQGGVMLMARQVTTGASQTDVRVDFDVPPSLRVTGTVYQQDAVTRVAGAEMQLSTLDVGTWSYLRSYAADASGSFSIGPLRRARYRLDVLAPNGEATSVELDLTDASGTVQRDIVLGAQVQVSTRVRVRAWVMGAQSGADLNAQVAVTNSRCPTGCVLGTLPRTLAPLTTDLLPPGLNTFEVTWRGRRQSFQVNVNAATNDQTLDREVDFPPDVTGVLSFPQQRSLYTLAAVAGESLDLVAGGTPVGGAASAYAVKMALFGPGGALLAEGHGFDERVIPRDYGAIRDFVAPATGTYTLVVSPYYEDPTTLGTYGLLAHAASPRLLQAWSAAGPGLGGRVGGRVLRPAGAVAAGETVRVAAGAQPGPRLVEQVQTLADGTYRYDNLPLGPVEVTARDGDAVLARGTTTLAAVGDAATVDLTLAPRTLLDVTVRLSSDLQQVYDLPVTVQDANGARQAGVVVFDGSSTSGVLRVVGVGDSVTLGASHPYSARVQASRVVQGSDGQVVPVQLELLTGRVAGRVVGPAGQAVPWASVLVTTPDGEFLDATSTDSQGVYQLPALPGGATVRLVATEPATGITAQMDVTVLGERTLNAPDLVLRFGSVTGRVLDHAGQPVAYRAVDLLSAGGTYLYAETNDQGVFRLDVVPVDQAIEVVVSHPVNGSVARTTFVARAGELTTLADLVFGGTGTVSGRVRLSNGQPLAGAVVIATNDNDARACRDQGAGGGMSPLSATEGRLLLQTVTDADGRYSIAELPQGGSFRVAAAQTALACTEQSVQASLAGGSQTVALPDIVFAATGGSLFLQVVDGAGLSVSAPSFDEDGCGGTVRVTQPDGTVAVVPAPPLEGRRYDNVQLGVHTARVDLACDTPLGHGTAHVTAQAAAPLNVVIPMLRGAIRFADGTAADDFSLTLVQHDANGNPGYFYGWSIPGGGAAPRQFMVFGMSLGDYEIRIGNSQYGLALTQTGTFVSTPGGTRDFVFGPSATVRGCAKQPDGSPAYPDYVTLETSQQANLYAAPDAQGCYEFQRVQAGPAMLAAYDWTNGLMGARRLVVTASTDRAVLQQDLHYAAPGTLRIVARDAQGLPLAGRRVRAVSAQMDPALRSLEADGYTSAAGTASFTLLPGMYSVNVSSGTDYQSPHVGATVVHIVSAQSVTATLPDEGRYLLLRDSAYYYADGLVTDGWRFMVNSAGTYFTSHPSERFAFNGGLELRVNGLKVPSTASADYPPGAREIGTGPYRLGADLQVSRRLFAPVTGGYGRIVDSVTNVSDTVQTVTLESRNIPWWGACASISTTMPQNSPRGYVAFEDCRGTAAIIYGGPGAAVQPLRVDVPSEASLVRWLLTVPPGQTAAVMHFHLLDEPGRLGLLTDRAATLVNGTEPSMLQGLSAADRQSIRNFNLGP